MGRIPAKAGPEKTPAAAEALDHLRLGRRRQVDPARAAALETGSAFDDELALCGDDLSRLVDGLEAEREQGITIDVAYRFFATDRRKLSSPTLRGTSNIRATWSPAPRRRSWRWCWSTRAKGVLTQTRRHSYLCRLLGVSRFVLLVNKMDLVGYDRAVFDRIVADYAALGESFTAIPVSALTGDNVTSRSPAMPWYEGPTLLEHLESVEPEAEGDGGPFEMPVQWVSRAGPARLRRDGRQGSVAARRPGPGDAGRHAGDGRPDRARRGRAGRGGPGPVGDAVLRRGGRLLARRRRRLGRTTRPESPTSSRRRSSGWRRRSWSPAGNMG